MFFAAREHPSQSRAPAKRKGTPFALDIGVRIITNRIPLWSLCNYTIITLPKTPLVLNQAPIVGADGRRADRASYSPESSTLNPDTPNLGV